MKERNIKSGNSSTTMQNEEAETLRLINVQEVADFLRISKDSVYKLVKTGELPASMIVNKLRFNRTAVEEYFRQKEVNK